MSHRAQKTKPPRVVMEDAGDGRAQMWCAAHAPYRRDSATYAVLMVLAKLADEQADARRSRAVR